MNQTMNTLKQDYLVLFLIIIFTSIIANPLFSAQLRGGKTSDIVFPIGAVVDVNDTFARWILPAHPSPQKHILIGPNLELVNFKSGIWRLGSVYGQPETRVLLRLRVPNSLADTVAKRKFEQLSLKLRVNVTSRADNDTLVLQAYSLDEDINFYRPNWNLMDGAGQNERTVIDGLLDETTVDTGDRWARLDLTKLFSNDPEWYRLLLAVKNPSEQTYLTMNSITTFHYYNRPRFIWTK